MECMNCSTHFTEKALYRTNEDFYTPGWMCLSCLEQAHPELYLKQLEKQEQKKKNTTLSGR